MDATPALVEIGKALDKAGLEAVLIGNAAAALQGAPVTTIDFDFLIRRTPRNVAKLKVVAGSLGAVMLRPFYPLSDLRRLARTADGLQVDFMTAIHGLRSYEGVRDRAASIRVGDVDIRVANLADIIRSKRAAGRAQDRAVLALLELAHAEAKKSPGASRASQARKRAKRR
jgi:hypothetical protein